jgi:beta-glucosidase/6-phospho-beta-glucosidase/beta-galactosidase
VTVYHFDLPQGLAEKGGWENRATIDAFVRYCDVLFDNLGDRVKLWLTINEQNMMILHGAAVGTGESTLKSLYQQNHHMLVAHSDGDEQLPRKITACENRTGTEHIGRLSEIEQPSGCPSSRSVYRNP